MWIKSIRIGVPSFIEAVGLNPAENTSRGISGNEKGHASVSELCVRDQIPSEPKIAEEVRKIGAGVLVETHSSFQLIIVSEEVGWSSLAKIDHCEPA